MKLILLLLLVSCGSRIELIKKTDTVFLPYIAKLQESLGITITSPVIFDILKDNIAGICDYRTKVIKIAYKYWITHTDEQREVLLLHEIGHCQINRRHSEATIRLGDRTCPLSVMRTPLFHKGEVMVCYRPNREYYLNELLN